MITADDIKRLVKDGENRHLEIKRCRDKLPKDIWETYSAFANTRGGVILLGVTEHKEKKGTDRFEFTGVSDTYKIITDFLNLVNNRQKVSRSVTVDNDVKTISVDGMDVIYIKVPEADYRQKPIYIDGNLQSGTYKRVFEGDRHVTDEELSMLIRDSSDHADATILDSLGMEFIDSETLRKYRQALDVNEVWLTLPLIMDNDSIYSLVNVPNKEINDPKDIKNVPNSGINVPNSNPISERRKKILELLHNNPHTTTDELMEVLGVSRKTVTRDLIHLSKEKKLTREGGSFGGKWVVL